MFGRMKYDMKQKIKKWIQYDRTQQQMSDMERKIVYEHIQRLERRLEKLEGGQEENFILSNDELPTLENPSSQMATANQFIEPIYSGWCARIKDKPKYHRKQWEFVFILQCLEKYGVLFSESRGIGFGVGKEPIPDYLASRGVYALVSDQEVSSAEKQGWVSTNQHSRSLADLQFRFISSPTQFRRYIQFRPIDMTNIPLDCVDYDFTWSACAFEHLGSINAGLDFVKNSIKCLKPGGVAVHTTEINVSDEENTIETGGTVLFRKRDFERLAKELRRDGHEIELNFQCGKEKLDLFYDVAPYSENLHLKIKLDQYVTTSYGLVIRKAGKT